MDWRLFMLSEHFAPDVPFETTETSSNTNKKSTRNSKVESAEESFSAAKLVGQKKAKVARKELDAIQLYLKEIEFSPLLKPEEEIKYGRLAREGDEFGRKKMIVSNLRLVVKISRRYMNRGLPLPDLIEEGNLGLIHAVESYCITASVWVLWMSI